MVARIARLQKEIEALDRRGIPPQVTLALRPIEDGKDLLLAPLLVFDDLLEEILALAITIEASLDPQGQLLETRYRRLERLRRR